MQHHSLRTVLGQPALHILVALGFVVAFSWPIIVIGQPRQTFYLLYVAWLLAIVVSFALSRGQPREQSSDAAAAASTPDQQGARPGGELR